MKIKKVSQTPLPTSEASVIDAYSSSTTDAYSCNYVNSMQTYSTTEHRVGTWVDGKPLYRKVVSFTTTSTANSWVTLPAGLSDVDKVVRIDGNIQKSNYVNALPYYKESDNTYIYVTYVYNSDVISHKVGSDMVSLPATVILEYTKTTDTVS